jgi:hypothetical protein
VYALNISLAIACIVLPLLAWKGQRWMVIVFAAALLAVQLDAMMVLLDVAARGIADQAIHSGTAVKDVTQALTDLKDAQWSARIAVVLSGVGLFLLAAIRRPTRIDRPHT